jgi:NADP-dependent aldehyde dehydrogenase
LFDSGYKTGKYLVVHPKTCAVAFTGSFSGGKALYDLAQTRINPIPVFAEMGSVNPVFILPQALKQSSPSIAKALAGSITLGAGQFCTNPGLIFLVDGPGSEEFLESLEGNIRKSIPETMLTPKIAANFRNSVKHLLDNQPIQKRSESGTSPGQNQSGALVAQVDGSTFEQSPQLAEEIFGPFSLIIKCSSIKQLLTIAGSLSGQLTASIFYDSLDDLKAVSELPGILRNKAGRIVFNGVPTGVEVCPAMNHGGPFPASTDGRFSSVGTSAIKRFVRPVAFQDCPDSLLPDELKVSNPMAISRLVNGKIEIRQ